MRRSSTSAMLVLTTSSTSGITSNTLGGNPPLEGRSLKVVLVDFWGRSAQEMPGGTPCPFLTLSWRRMKRCWSSPRSFSSVTSLTVVLADPVPSASATTVFRGMVTGAVLPARSSAQVPPAWIWLMCSTPFSGSPSISSSTFTPSSTSLRVAVPLTPESRLGVRWSLTLFSSLAKALPPRTTDANNVAPNTITTTLFSRYTILLLHSSLTLIAFVTYDASVQSYYGVLIPCTPSIAL